MREVSFPPYSKLVWWMNIFEVFQFMRHEDVVSTKDEIKFLQSEGICKQLNLKKKQ